MQIQEPKRKAIYCLLSKDAKNSLDQLAKYHRTSLTSLIEEGAHMVIRSHLKQIQARQFETESLSKNVSNW